MTTYNKNQIFECWRCGGHYRYGASTSTSPICFCSGLCQVLYKIRTGRELPPAGGLIPLGSPGMAPPPMVDGSSLPALGQGDVR